MNEIIQVLKIYIYICSLSLSFLYIHRYLNHFHLHRIWSWHTHAHWSIQFVKTEVERRSADHLSPTLRLHNQHSVSSFNYGQSRSCQGKKIKINQSRNKFAFLIKLTCRLPNLSDALWERINDNDTCMSHEY